MSCPFRADERGRERSERGMRGEEVVCVEWWWPLTSVAHPRRPGHTPRASLRSHAPLSLQRKGQGGRLSRTSSFLHPRPRRPSGFLPAQE